jgi:hypothetical protein
MQDYNYPVRSVPPFTECRERSPELRRRKWMVACFPSDASHVMFAAIDLMIGCQAFCSAHRFEHGCVNINRRFIHFQFTDAAMDLKPPA